MAKTLSPMWMAPVLQGGGEGGGAEVRDYTRQAASLDADNDASCSRSRRHGRDLSNNRE